MITKHDKFASLQIRLQQFSCLVGIKTRTKRLTMKCRKIEMTF